MIKAKNTILLLFIILFSACNSSSQRTDIALKAAMDNAMGSNSLEIYEDKTFQLRN